MAKKNNNKPANNVILQRAQNLDNMEDWTHFDSSMTREEIERKFMEMVNIAKQSKGK